MTYTYKSTDDYPTLSALNSAENNKPNDIIIFDVKKSIDGGFLDKFPGGLIITTSNDSEITTGLTVETYAETTINNVKTQNINASTMCGNLIINDADTANIEPETFPNTAFRPDGSVNFDGIAYFNQIPNFGE